MKPVKLLPYLLLLGLLFALAASGSLGLAQEPDPPDEQALPQGIVSIAATVSSRFSYQGLLKENGSPVTGSRDMTFRLYSDDTCSTQVGSDIVKSGVPVANGLFSVELDVAHDDFNGQGLWLEVEVGGTKIGCQEILPVPYALSLRPGAYINGAVAGSGLRVDNAATSGKVYGVFGRTNSSSSWTAGVFGEATAPSGDEYLLGVYGRTNSNSHASAGVRGAAEATSGETFGVWGVSKSSQGWGVYGRASANNGWTQGVHGECDSPDCYGVVGRANANSGATRGVYGRSDSLDGYGVYGFNSAGGYAGYFNGDVAQSRAADGLVKAGVYATCGTAATIDRSFNNVAGTITITSGAAGSCIIDFGFSVDDRFWVATAGGGAARIVVCVPGTTSNRLTCYRHNHAGVGEDGYIMVLVY